MLDCNYCVNISLTEWEQDRKGKQFDHTCMCYNTRLFHAQHNPKGYHHTIYPCVECINDDYRNYDRKEITTCFTENDKKNQFTTSILNQ